MANNKTDKKFESELMNFDGDRYDVVVLASIWAKELKKQAEKQLFQYREHKAQLQEYFQTGLRERRYKARD